MFTKDKGRASNPTDSTAKQNTVDITTILSTITTTTVLAKDIYPKIAKPNTFSDDRKKFKAYEI
jgi:hypothetical protein